MVMMARTTGNLYVLWSALVAGTVGNVCLAFVPSPVGLSSQHGLPTSFIPIELQRLNMQSGNGGPGQNDDHLGQALDAVRSLADFHGGSWKGSCRSFSVTPDVAAGIVLRKQQDYEVRVEIQTTKEDFELNEEFFWDEEAGDNNNDEDDNGSDGFSRMISLKKSRVDVDDVDGSYSLDQTVSGSTSFLPPTLVGTNKAQSIVVEHTLAVSDDKRARLWALYGEDSGLARVVVSQEERIKDAIPKRPQASSMELELLDMQSDVDKLVEKLTGGPKGSTELTSTSSSPSPSSPVLPSNPMEQLQNSLNKKEDGGPPLSLHPANLLEISSGLWLGDLIIRDFPNVPISPLERSKGFGDSAEMARTNPQPTASNAFANWSIGVQKVAWRWMWNFGEEIRQVTDAGKAMGAAVAEAARSSLAGSVCVNEGLARRIPVDDRMVYVDWSGDNVGFLTGSTSVQLPRFFTFGSRTTVVKPLYTEFSVFQSAVPMESADEEPLLDEDGEILPKLPTIVCSRNTRIYNFEGDLKQGCSSFYTLQRFGIDDNEI